MSTPMHRTKKTLTSAFIIALSLLASTCDNPILGKLKQLALVGDWENPYVSGGTSPVSCGVLSIKADGTYDTRPETGTGVYAQDTYTVEGTWENNGKSGFKVVFHSEVDSANFCCLAYLSQDATKLEMNWVVNGLPLSDSWPAGYLGVDDPGGNYMWWKEN